MSIGERLREVREYLCLSTAEAATSAGMALEVLASIEDGRREPDELELQRLARTYEHPAAYFRDGSTAPVPAGLLRGPTELSDRDRRELTRFAAFLHDTSDPS
jgi:transcriptional regulator with XRE-family HTH domain